MKEPSKSRGVIIFFKENHNNSPLLFTLPIEIYGYLGAWGIPFVYFLK